MAIKIQDEIVIDDDKILRLGTGNTSNRPSSPVAGMFRYNTNISSYEIYTGTLWAPVITSEVVIATPTVSVTGSPSSVPHFPTISTSAFSVTTGTSSHESTDWEVRRTSDNSLVYSSYSNTSNKTSITLPPALAESTQYYFRAKHNGTVGANSDFGSVTATTLSSFFPSLGCSYYGGYYIGTICAASTCYALVLAPNSSGCSCCQYKVTNTASVETANCCDGYANTYAQANTDHPALCWAASRTINGFSDWYLPSACEIVILANNQTCPPAGEGFAPEIYWSSTSYSGSPCFAVSQNFSANTTVSCLKATVFPVRAIRRVAIT